jgi:hypothetical protein
LQQYDDVYAANADAVSCALRRGSPWIGIEKNIGANDGATWLAARGERETAVRRVSARLEEKIDLVLSPQPNSPVINDRSLKGEKR